MSKKADGAHLAPLQLALQGADLTGMEALSAREAAALAESVHAARDRQRQALAAAVDDALSHLPALLRKAVRRALR